MAEVTKHLVCMWCQESFSYVYRGGRHRRFCSTDCAHAQEGETARLKREAENLLGADPAGCHLA